MMLGFVSLAETNCTFAKHDNTSASRRNRDNFIAEQTKDPPNSLQGMCQAKARSIQGTDRETSRLAARANVETSQNSLTATFLSAAFGDRTRSGGTRHHFPSNALRFS